MHRGYWVVCACAISSLSPMLKLPGMLLCACLRAKAIWLYPILAARVQLTRDLFAIAKFLVYISLRLENWSPQKRLKFTSYHRLEWLSATLWHGQSSTHSRDCRLEARETLLTLIATSVVWFGLERSVSAADASPGPGLPNCRPAVHAWTHPSSLQSTSNWRLSPVYRRSYWPTGCHHHACKRSLFSHLSNSLSFSGYISPIGLQACSAIGRLSCWPNRPVTMAVHQYAIHAGK